MSEKGFNKYKLSKVLEAKIPEGYSLYIKNSNFISPICTFPLAGNIIVYKPNQGISREKYFNDIIIKGKMPILAVNKHFSDPFFLHGQRLFQLSTEKVRVRSVRNGHQSGCSRADTKNNNINKRSEKLSI